MHLLHPEEKVDSHFKFWIKGRRFQLVDQQQLHLFSQ